MILSKDLSEFVALLNAAKVEYLVAGAHAMAWHGRPRFTGDLDLFIRPSLENAQRVLQVLADFGFGQVDVTVDDLKKPDSLIQLGMAPNRIDLLTDLTGLTFDEAWQNKEFGRLGEHPVAYLCKADLIRNKRTLGRPQDLADVALLESLSS
jgi:hypothetical protein